MNRLKLLLLSTIIFTCYGNLLAQNSSLKKNYSGLIPSVLVEPYDTIDAVEINFFPFLYELRIGKSNDVGFQIRPILNYRFLKGKNGFSQIGGTVVMNKYFLNIFDDNFWLKPQFGVFYTYAYNRLDKIKTMTLGIEPGAFMKITEGLSLSVNLQPGINYYPNKFSQVFVGTKSGFKGHFGFIFHIGYNF